MNTKKILAGVMALSLTAALTACGGGNGADGETTTSEATTTTKATVAVNTEGDKVARSLRPQPIKRRLFQESRA